MSDIDLQNVSEKLANKLDDVSKSFEDAVAKRASVEDVETLKADLAEQKKQMQEMAAAAKNFATRPVTDQDKCRMIGEAVLKAQTEGTAAEGGNLVDDEFSHEIRSTQNKYGAVRQIWGSGIIPMATDVLKVPVDTYEGTAGSDPVPIAVAEEAQFTEDAATVAQVTLTAAKYGTMVFVSNELMADSFVDFIGNYLRTKIARQAAKKEDDLVFNTASTGILKSSNILEVVMGAGNDTFASLTLENVRALQDSVTDEAFEEGSYYMHRSIKTLVANTRVGGSTTTDGAFGWGNPNVGIPPTFDGYTVNNVSKMPTSADTAASTEFLLFGDLPMGMLVGERGTAELAVSPHHRFDYDQQTVRYAWRFAYSTDANIGRAIARLKTAA